MAKGLADVHNHMSYSRYAIRLINGLPMSLIAAKEGSWDVKDVKGVEGYLDDEEMQSLAKPSKAALWASRTLSWSMLGYYPTEALALAQWKFPSLLHDAEPQQCHVDSNPLVKVREGWGDSERRAEQGARAR